MSRRSRALFRSFGERPTEGSFCEDTHWSMVTVQFADAASSPTMSKTDGPPVYYPVFLSLEGRVCLVVGGGSVAERKVLPLVAQGASVRLVARDLTRWLRDECDRGTLAFVGHDFDPPLLEGVDLVFAATSDAVLNAHIAEEAQARRIWCNSATEPEDGSFIVPAVVRQGALTIAVSTGGHSPGVAKRLRQQLEAQFGREWAVFLDLMRLVRKSIQARELGTHENQRIFRELAQLPIPEWIERGEPQRVREAIGSLCFPWLTPEDIGRIWNQAWKGSSSSLQPCATSAQR